MKNVIEHLKNIAGSKEIQKTRPVLGNIKLTSGVFLATDKLRAIKVKHNLPITTDTLLDLDTLNTPEAFNIENYPSIEGLFKELDDKNSVVMSFKISKLQLKLLNAMKQETALALVPASDSKTITVMDKDQLTSIISFDSNEELAINEAIYVVPSYFIELIKVLIDSDTDEFKFLNVDRNILPMQFAVSDVDYIIMPLRTPIK